MVTAGATVKTLPHAPMVQQCQQSKLGKCLPGALYVHRSAIAHLAPTLQQYEQTARAHLTPDIPYTLVKFHFDQPVLSYLYYPDFDRDAHPALHASTQVDLRMGQLRYRDYSQTPNPPILHRKETFLAAAHPHYAQFARLTRQQEAFGLLDNARTIGTQQGWEARLAQHRLVVHDHALACPLGTSPTPTAKPATARPKIDRHKAALVRKALSKPVRLALEAGLFPPETTFFDYGCGHGGDVNRIAQKGFTSQGWDPFYQPDTPHQPAQVVNLGYIINVIENPAERRDALVNAWHLTKTVLIVAAQVLVADSQRGLMAYEDGIITRRNTFQKYYEQEELKIYIDQVLGTDAVPVALGIYFVFRDEAQAESFRASRFRSRATTPRVRLSVKRFEDYKTLLQPLMDFYTERGRLPTVEEMAESERQPISETFGSIRRAFKVVLQATETREWDSIADRRRQDLLVYLALSQFSRRPKFRDLSPAVQQDIRALFGSYKQACTAADLMLMTLGNMDAIAARIHQSPVGQQRPGSLLVHLSALEQLDPLLRLYEGCAARTLGRPEDATVVKFHVDQPKISYLFFPHFDRDAHPALHTRMDVRLQDLQVRYRDYDLDNPPLLHQKEQLVTPDYPSYEKFNKLSQQEQNWGLLDEIEKIYSQKDWETCLEQHCAQIQGHRVVWRKDADPYRKKLIQSARRRRSRRPAKPASAPSPCESASPGS
ncbi:MAG: DNA phosphorothioation-associated putative methyltransferase [Cyanobacteria bacterium P01_D01_bin.14]